MSLRDQLQTVLGTAYTIDRELAGGGMSRVFVATEVALGRQVVVKVLHPELAAEVTAERFSREIQLVARLQQANIVPLLTTGHTGEVPYYTMPFVEGLSLRQRVAESGRLPIPEVVSILRDVARALAYAHDAGVVHRDIKPENVLLSGGAAVVTDFGIAKAVSMSRTQPGAATITQAGAGIGTPAYMAPEQAAGDPTVDHRVDIYAFGCLGYELLAGHPPFRDTTVHELIAAHMTRTPATVATLRPDAPPALVRLIMRCLEKQPGRRPQSARELLDSLDAVATPASWTGDSLHGRRRQIVSVVLVVLAVIGFAEWRINRAGGGAAVDGPSAVAVIPFANVGGDSAQDYLADGISDELATAIGKLPGVRVAARSGAYRYRGRRDVDVRDVGKTLAVSYVVQGTVRRSGDQLRVAAQLTDARTGVELWANSFDRTTKDVFRTQDDIAIAVSAALASRVSSATPGSTKQPATLQQGTADAEAYDLYLRGEFNLRQRRVAIAAEQFQQAIARDSKFARAYAGLSQTLALTPYFSPTPNDSIFGRVVSASGKALALDSTLAEAHMALGIVYMHSYRWDEARAEYERAVAADPTDVQTHFQFGRYYFYLGNDSMAIVEWNRAKAIDPYSALAAAWLSQLYATRGRVPEALAEARRAIEYDSVAAVISQMATRAYMAAGDKAKAIAFADRMPNIAPWSGMTGFAHAKMGDREGALAILRRLEATPERLWFRNTGIAYVYSGLGDTTRMLAALERAADNHEVWAAFNRIQDPIFDQVRHSARWAALVKRVGLEGTPGSVK